MIKSKSGVKSKFIAKVDLEFAPNPRGRPRCSSNRGRSNGHSLNTTTNHLLNFACTHPVLQVKLNHLRQPMSNILSETSLSLRAF